MSFSPHAPPRPRPPVIVRIAKLLAALALCEFAEGPELPTIRHPRTTTIAMLTAYRLFRQFVCPAALLVAASCASQGIDASATSLDSSQASVATSNTAPSDNSTPARGVTTTREAQGDSSSGGLASSTSTRDASQAPPLFDSSALYGKGRTPIPEAIGLPKEVAVDWATRSGWAEVVIADPEKDLNLAARPDHRIIFTLDDKDVVVEAWAG